MPQEQLTVKELDSLLTFIENCNSMVVATEEDTLYIKLMNMREDARIVEAAAELEDANRE